VRRFIPPFLFLGAVWGEKRRRRRGRRKKWRGLGSFSSVRGGKRNGGGREGEKKKKEGGEKKKERSECNRLSKMCDHFPLGRGIGKEGGGGEEKRREKWESNVIYDDVHYPPI